MTTQAYMTLTTVAAWVFLALVAIGLAYGIYAAVTEHVGVRNAEREDVEQDDFAFETLEEAVYAYRRARDNYNRLLTDYNELQDKYQDIQDIRAHYTRFSSMEVELKFVVLQNRYR